MTSLTKSTATVADLARSYPGRVRQVALHPPPMTIPLLARVAHAGFPSPAMDYLDQSLNLHDLLVSDRPATFFMRVATDDMQGFGIRRGDILVVDRGRTPLHEQIVVAELDGEFVVRQFRQRGNRVALVTHGEHQRAMVFEEGQELRVFGVVTSSIHQFVRTR